jgi:hypothetical protein
MQLPANLKDFNIYVNGTNFLGRAKDFKPPQIKVEMESERYAGMDGKVKHDMGMEEMEAKLKMGELSKELASLVGSIEEVPITMYGYAEVSPGGQSTEIVLTMRGRLTEQDVGDIASGKKTDIDFNMSLTAYKEVIGGITTKDIDVLAIRRIIGGKDVLAAKRSALKA